MMDAKFNRDVIGLLPSETLGCDSGLVGITAKPELWWAGMARSLSPSADAGWEAGCVVGGAEDTL